KDRALNPIPRSAKSILDTVERRDDVGLPQRAEDGAEHRDADAERDDDVAVDPAPGDADRSTDVGPGRRDTLAEPLCDPDHGVEDRLAGDLPDRRDDLPRERKASGDRDEDDLQDRPGDLGDIDDPVPDSLHRGPCRALEPIDRRADRRLDAAPDGLDDLLANLGLRAAPGQARPAPGDAGNDQPDRVRGHRG